MMTINILDYRPDIEIMTLIMIGLSGVVNELRFNFQANLVVEIGAKECANLVHRQYDIQKSHVNQGEMNLLLDLGHRQFELVWTRRRNAN
jgi:hypothetical protein